MTPGHSRRNMDGSKLKVMTRWLRKCVNNNSARGSHTFRYTKASRNTAAQGPEKEATGPVYLEFWWLAEMWLIPQ